MEELNFEALQDQIRQCRICRETFGFEPHPIVYGHQDAKILILGQAPGLLASQANKPFADPSGKRLRQWLQVSEEEFYNPDLFYFGMSAHCFPGKQNGRHDAKPPRICFEQWGRKELEGLNSIQLILILGMEGASRLLGKGKLETLAFQDLEYQGIPCFVLPHPSPLNALWIKKHPAFLEERLPEIQKRVRSVIDQQET